MIVLFAALGVIVVAGQSCRSDGLDDLQAILVLVLLAVAFVLVHFAGHRRDPGTRAEACDLAGVDAAEEAQGIVAARCRGAHDAELISRVHRIELQGAAKIARGGYIQRARALRQCHAAQVLADQCARDVQAIVVAIAHVAERDAIERESQLVLVEAADVDAHGPFVGAKRVSAGDGDTRQSLDNLDRARARRLKFKRFTRDCLGLANFARTDHHYGIKDAARLIGGEIFACLGCTLRVGAERRCDGQCGRRKKELEFHDGPAENGFADETAAVADAARAPGE